MQSAYFETTNLTIYTSVETVGMFELQLPWFGTAQILRALCNRGARGNGKSEDEGMRGWAWGGWFDGRRGCCCRWMLLSPALLLSPGCCCRWISILPSPSSCQCQNSTVLPCEITPYPVLQQRNEFECSVLPIICCDKMIICFCVGGQYILPISHLPAIGKYTQETQERTPRISRNIYIAYHQSFNYRLLI